VHGAFQKVSLETIPFWFLWHRGTAWNAQGISQAHVDIPLNGIGIAQARAAAQKRSAGSGVRVHKSWFAD